MERWREQADLLSSATRTPESAGGNASHAGLEQALARVWAEVFRVEHIDTEANFFELGGNSLLGMDLTEMLEDRLGIQVSVVTLFRNPTIREMAEAIREEDSV
jgi:aryl carrier-like protein